MSVLPIFYAIVSARYFLTAWLLCASDGSGGVSMKFCCFAPCTIGALIAATPTIAHCRSRQRTAIFTPAHPSSPGLSMPVCLSPTLFALLPLQAPSQRLDLHRVVSEHSFSVRLYLGC